MFIGVNFSVMFHDFGHIHSVILIQSCKYSSISLKTMAKYPTNHLHLRLEMILKSVIHMISRDSYNHMCNCAVLETNIGYFRLKSWFVNDLWFCGNKLFLWSNEQCFSTFYMFSLPRRLWPGKGKLHPMFTFMIMVWSEATYFSTF